jgi:hypothetical protein
VIRRQVTVRQVEQENTWPGSAFSMQINGLAGRTHPTRSSEPTRSPAVPVQVQLQPAQGVLVQEQGVVPVQEVQKALEVRQRRLVRAWGASRTQDGWSKRRLQTQRPEQERPGRKKLGC